MLLESSLYSPKSLIQDLGITEQQHAFIAYVKERALSLFSREDKRILLILGPCSIHNIDSALEYALRVKELQKKIDKNFFLIMRVYVEKARSALGWKGLLYDPYLDGTQNIKDGIRLSRQLFLDLASLEVPTATEFIDPLSAYYLEDLVTWGFIGARTSSSQIHRGFASRLSIPIGFKNSIDGNLVTALQGALSAQTVHSYLGIDPEGRLQALQSDGNPHTHLVLRGSSQATNYDKEALHRALYIQNSLNIRAPLLIDCAHGNSQKKAHKQLDVFQNVLDSLQDPTLQPHILGLMLESFLKAGSQPFSPSIDPHLSLTDPCLSWQETEDLLLQANERL